MLKVRIRPFIWLSVGAFSLDWISKASFVSFSESSYLLHEASRSSLIIIPLLGLCLLLLANVANNLITLACALIMGGVLGNLIELKATGSALDFIQMPQLGPLQYYCNLADFMLVLGCSLIMALLFTVGLKPRTQKAYAA